MRILHLSTGLGLGGAERMLVDLARALAPAVDQRVVSLLSPGPLARELGELGVPVHSLHLSRGFPFPLGLLRLGRLVRAEKPDLIQTWMYHASLAASLLPKPGPLVFGVHNVNLDPAHVRPRTIAVARTLGLFARRAVVKRIVYCSESARAAHEALQWPKEKGLVIENGVDLARFSPDGSVRKRMRETWGFGDRDLLVGLPARFDPLKDHTTFLAAASIAAGQNPRLGFVLCGAGIDDDNPELCQRIADGGLAARIRLLGPISSMPDFYRGLDLVCLSSRGEAFPLALVEALATGLPLVSTEVGDAARIVGQAGLLVPPGDPNALAKALLYVADEETRTVPAAKARAQAERFSVDRTAAAYREVWQSALNPQKQAPSTQPDRWTG